MSDTVLVLLWVITVFLALIIIILIIWCSYYQQDRERRLDIYNIRKRTQMILQSTIQKQERERKQNEILHFQDPLEYPLPSIV